MFAIISPWILFPILSVLCIPKYSDSLARIHLVPLVVLGGTWWYFVTFYAAREQKKERIVD